jgi:hypothetical protein
MNESEMDTPYALYNYLFGGAAEDLEKRGEENTCNCLGPDE